MSMLSSAEVGKDKVGKNWVILCLEWPKILLASLPAVGSAHPDPLDHVFGSIFLKNTKPLNANKPSPHSLFLQNSPPIYSCSLISHGSHGPASTPSWPCPISTQSLPVHPLDMVSLHIPQTLLYQPSPWELHERTKG